MIVSNPALVSDFQYYVNQFVIGSSINKYGIPIPVSVNPICLEKGSVVELLSNNNFPYTEYKYLYQNINVSSWPEFVRTRLMIYPGSSYLVPKDTGLNIFNLQNHDFILLDTLLQYRHDSTSVTIIEDSTAVQLTIDSTTNTAILICSFNNLQTPLSKLIYLYLQLKIYEDYTYYNDLNVISPCTLLETYFELKLLDEYFEFLTKRDIKFDIACR